MTSTERWEEKGQLEACPVLLPGLDLLNHSPAAKVTWRWTGQACCIDTETLLPGGTEILNNYAPKSNEERETAQGNGIVPPPANNLPKSLWAMALVFSETLLTTAI